MFYGTSSATNKPSGTDHAVATFSYSDAWQTQLAMDWRTNSAYLRTQENGTWKSWNKFFTDGYHPNADKWTTARTLSLSGDASGSVSWDGSANAALSVTVADDSHNHVWGNIDGASVGSLSGPRFTTASGYIEFGPANTTWAHIYTDRPNFYFNRELYVNSNRVYNTAYHPEADKWTTARTLTLTGDVTGSVSWDGSGNASLSTVVGNDSHYHSQVYIPDTRGAARAPSYYPDKYVSFDFQNNADTGAGGDTWNVLQTISPWSAYDNSHRQQQIAFTGSGGIKFRYATSESAWAGWQTIWTSANDGSGSGLDADLLDGQQGSYYYPASNPNGYTTNVGDITGVTAGSGITGGGTSGTVTINHADTSSQASVNNSDGTVIQDITLDTYGHITGIASTNLDGRFVNVTGDTMTGNLTVDAGTSTTLSVKCDDAGLAMVRANGDSQGTGAIEVGQSDAHGGGISYNGDSSPAFVSGETADRYYLLPSGPRAHAQRCSAIRIAAVGSRSMKRLMLAALLCGTQGNDGSGSGLDADLLGWV